MEKKRGEYSSLTNSNSKKTSIVKDNLRRKTPKLTLNELRRIRMPLHEALLIELKESNHQNAHRFFEEIIQQDLRESKILVEDNKLMEIIFHELKKAEFSSKEEEIDIFMKLGKDIHIRWVADRMFMRSLSMLASYQSKSNQLEANVKYHYGKFLYDEDQTVQASVDILTESWNICSGVDEWLVEADAEQKSNALYFSVSKQLCKALIKQSKLIQNKSVEKSLELATKSRKFFKNNRTLDDVKLEVQIELRLGDCQLGVRNFLKAQSHFNLAFQLATVDVEFYSKPKISLSTDFHDNAFEALLKLAECFEKLNDAQKQEFTLSRARNYAQEHHLKIPESDVLMILGQFWVDRKESIKALELFNQAIERILEVGDLNKLFIARISVAEILFQQILSEIVEVILKCDKFPATENIHLNRLIRWYDRQNPINPSHSCDNDSHDPETFIKKYLDPDEITRTT